MCNLSNQIGLNLIYLKSFKGIVHKSYFQNIHWRRKLNNIIRTIALEIQFAKKMQDIQYKYFITFNWKFSLKINWNIKTFCIFERLSGTYSFCLWKFTCKQRIFMYTQRSYQNPSLESLTLASATRCKNSHFTDIFLSKCQRCAHLLNKLSTTEKGLLWLNVICKLLGVLSHHLTNVNGLARQQIHSKNKCSSGTEKAQMTPYNNSC